MKSKHLKLNNPCSEKWENMTPNELGSFCKSCSKNVIDFTQLSPFEISNKLKKANGNICARLTKKQLDTPLFDGDIPRPFSWPYSNMVAGLMLATTLTCGQNLPAENARVQTEFVQVTSAISASDKSVSQSTSNELEPGDFTTFSGTVTTENGEPIEHATITFVTITKIVVTHTLKDGSFSLELPTELVDNKNVVRVSYNEIKSQNDKEMFWGYETDDYILSKTEIKSNYKIQAIPIELVRGGIGYYSDSQIPIVISNGKEIKYKDFIRAQQGKKSSCNLENKEYYYFAPQSAIVIYGKKAKYGLYILTDEN